MSVFVRIIDETEQTTQPDKCIIYKGWMSTLPRMKEQIAQNLDNHNPSQVFIVTLVIHEIGRYPSRHSNADKESAATVYVRKLS